MMVESWAEFFRLLFFCSIIGGTMAGTMAAYIPKRRTAKLMVELEKLTHDEAHLHQVLAATRVHFPNQNLDWQLNKTIATVKKIRQEKTAPGKGAV